MIRKKSLVNIAFVLCTLAVVIVVLGGYLSIPAPISPTATLVPTSTVSSPMMVSGSCPVLPSIRDVLARDAAVGYVSAHYPDQNVPLVDHWETKGGNYTFNYTLGDWVADVVWASPCQVIVNNQVTGFEWKGEVYISLQGTGNWPNCYMEKVNSVSEKSVTIPKSIVTPTPTR